MLILSALTPTPNLRANIPTTALQGEGSSNAAPAPDYLPTPQALHDAENQSPEQETQIGTMSYNSVSILLLVEILFTAKQATRLWSQIPRVAQGMGSRLIAFLGN